MGKIGRPQNEVNAMKYENFLKRGFRFNRRVSRASKSELINLINCENGIKHTFLPNREKQLSEIKGRLIKAIELKSLSSREIFSEKHLTRSADENTPFSSPPARSPIERNSILSK